MSTSGGNQVGSSTCNFPELSSSLLYAFGEFLDLHYPINIQCMWWWVNLVT
ncbi:Uncharacterized protein TCM_022675 [Theobroma cacao]|uniref:Uncharacterized protein n=1 Tax=Theobroma cacao TaxID=3641 RepID=A0A061EU47_THECC|nr:Uncharacterized protein TCM_022675 [Theobroma cacao]